MKVTKSGIAKNISDALQDHEPPMTIKNLADKTGVGESKLKRILSGAIDENGNKRLPNTDDLLAIASALDVSPYWLLTGNSDENHVVCEELGLASKTVDELRKWNNIDKSKAGRIYAQGVIDVLVANPELLYAIGNYFFNDFNSMMFCDFGKEKKQPVFLHLSDDTNITPDDYERMTRLRLLDWLKAVRNDLRKGKNDETGKR